MNESRPGDEPPELMKIVHEQATKIRALEKDKAKLAQQNEQIMEDMTVLNNQLTTINRNTVKQNKVVERLNHQLNDLMGMTVHDIRNSLLRIKGFSQVLQDTFDISHADSEAGEIINNVVQSGDEALLILNDLLDISKIESGNLKIKKESLDLRQLLKKAIQLNKVLAQNKNIDLVLAAGDEPIWVEVDPNRIHQVLSNLLSNAIKFSQATSKIEMGVDKVNEQAALWVQDHGMGMDEQSLSSIRSGGKATGRVGTSGEKSNGLGLAICKKVIDAHGGKMEVESSPEQGTRFTLSVPMLDTIPAPTASAPPLEDQREAKTILPMLRWNRLLVVDDQPLNLNLVKMALKNMAKEIITATNPLEVLKNQTENYDLVISDMEMPQMKGDRLIQQLKADGRTNMAVLLTAHEYSATEIEELETLGVDKILKKPLTRRQLLQIL